MFTFWEVSLFCTVFIYSFLYDLRLIAIWLVMLVGYTIVGLLVSKPEDNSNRTKMRMATWQPPRSPDVYVKIEVNLEKADKLIEEQQKLGKKITYTAIAAKGAGLAMKDQMQYNGKIVFNRFVPLPDVNVLTLVDIDSKDLAGMTLRKCDKVGISELMEQMKGKISRIKNQKDEDHKAQTGSAR